MKMYRDKKAQGLQKMILFIALLSNNPIDKTII